jgi:hypothetical protein
MKSWSALDGRLTKAWRKIEDEWRRIAERYDKAWRRTEGRREKPFSARLVAAARAAKI